MKHRRAGLFWHLSCCEIQQPHAALQTRFPVPRAVKSPSPWAIQETLVVRSQAFQLTTKEARAAPNVVTGTFLVNIIPTLVLFYLGTTRSFVSLALNKGFGDGHGEFDYPFEVEITNYRPVRVSSIHRVVC
ncbi:uncharacterized protein LOC111921560 isoform X1 [Lactuca sativa]|uniref:uncharacterized protein LOC111921560 isoform X1 n=1 Tax=Lactuca sativa TaxID=4236 RepID=UPI0022AF6C2C|nr:uncharacterized protein LOC111921560 isoform X1 [Lactuca sativa]